MAKFRTQNNYKAGQGREKSHGSSLTIENQAYSIKELLKRAEAGGMPGIERPIVYFDQEDQDDMAYWFKAGMDLTDLDAWAVRNQKLADAIQRAEENKREAEIEAAAQKKLDEEILANEKARQERKENNETEGGDE